LLLSGRWFILLANTPPIIVKSAIITKINLAFFIMQCFCNKKLNFGYQDLSALMQFSPGGGGQYPTEDERND
jgi:hypothetical protein